MLGGRLRPATSTVHDQPNRGHGSKAEGQDGRDVCGAHERTGEPKPNWSEEDHVKAVKRWTIIVCVGIGCAIATLAFNYGVMALFNWICPAGLGQDWPR